MISSGSLKRGLNTEKTKEIWENIFSEDSILNYPVEMLIGRLLSYLKDQLKLLGEYFERFWKELESYSWVEELEEYAKEPFSKMAVLVFANVLVFTWILGTGIATDLLPKGMSAYMPVALGAENEEADLSGGLKKQDNKMLEPKADLEENSFSEAKCEKDKEEGRCSSLCADIEDYIKVTKDMSEEEKRAWQKVAKDLASRKPKRASNVATDRARISCREANDGNPSKSKTKGKHMDEDCCPDPDEWPKSGCVYSVSGLSLMLKGPR